MIESAGTVLYRRNGGKIEVLIVHPWGPYNRRAPWSIPKGRTNPGEDLETAARRETVEETGVKASKVSVNLPLSVVEVALKAAPETLESKGRIKLDIGLAKGKKDYDKRETEKNRDWEREKAQLMRSKRG